MSCAEQCPPSVAAQYDAVTHPSQWWVYLLRNSLGQLYCGISTDVTRRIAQHECGKGAKSLRGKGPLSLEWTQPAASHSQALICEARIKRWPKAKKEALVKNQSPLPI